MKDGMLHIDIDRIVPEDKKPKEVTIRVAKK
jgi:HSP20 family molecular chaperone IbpA